MEAVIQRQRGTYLARTRTVLPCHEIIPCKRRRTTGTQPRQGGDVNPDLSGIIGQGASHFWDNRKSCVPRGHSENGPAFERRGSIFDCTFGTERLLKNCNAPHSRVITKIPIDMASKPSISVRYNVMNPIVHQTIGSKLHALPAAMVFSKQLLLTEKSSITAEPGSPKFGKDDLTVRATRITKILFEIEGYPSRRTE
jgi:hypothetical protein